MRSSFSRNLRHAFGLACVLLVPIGGALARKPEPPSAVSDEACRNDLKCWNDVQKGITLTQSGKLREALQTFEAAYARHPSPTVLFHQARCLQNLDEFAQAQQRYEQLLSTAGVDAALSAPARIHLAEVRAAILSAQSAAKFVGRGASPPVRSTGTTGDISQTMVGPTITISNLFPAPVQSPPPSEPPPPPRRKWLWPVVISSSLAGAAGVALGIGLTLGLPQHPRDIPPL